MARDFKWVWIPKDIRSSESLSLQEKVFLVEIDSLDNENGCFANNGYFSKFFWISKTRVSLVIKSLSEKWYVSCKISKKLGNRRTISVKPREDRPIKGKLNRVYKESLRPLKQKLTHSNTINNTYNKLYTSISPEIEDVCSNIFLHNDVEKLDDNLSLKQNITKLFDNKKSFDRIISIAERVKQISWSFWSSTFLSVRNINSIDIREKNWSIYDVVEALQRSSLFDIWYESSSELVDEARHLFETDKDLADRYPQKSLASVS